MSIDLVSEVTKHVNKCILPDPDNIVRQLDELERLDAGHPLNKNYEAFVKTAMGGVVKIIERFLRDEESCCWLACSISRDRKEVSGELGFNYWEVRFGRVAKESSERYERIYNELVKSGEARSALEFLHEDLMGLSMSHPLMLEVRVVRGPIGLETREQRTRLLSKTFGCHAYHVGVSVPPNVLVSRVQDKGAVLSLAKRCRAVMSRMPDLKLDRSGEGRGVPAMESVRGKFKNAVVCAWLQDQRVRWMYALPCLMSVPVGSDNKKLVPFGVLLIGLSELPSERNVLACSDAFNAAFKHVASVKLQRRQLEEKYRLLNAIHDINRHIIPGLSRPGDESAETEALSRYLSRKLDYCQDEAMGVRRCRETDIRKLIAEFPRYGLSFAREDININWEHVSCKSTGDCVISTDERAVETIFENLFSNSFEKGNYEDWRERRAPDDQSFVEIVLDRTGTTLKVEYWDNGVGFKPEAIGRLPEWLKGRFLSREMEGGRIQGFGLWTVASAVASISGSIEWTMLRRKGDTGNAVVKYTLSLPHLESRRVSVQLDHNQKTRSLLIIDFRGRSEARTLADAFRCAGYDVRTCSSVEEGAKIAEGGVDYLLWHLSGSRYESQVVSREKLRVIVEQHFRGKRIRYKYGVSDSRDFVVEAQSLGFFEGVGSWAYIKSEFE